MGVGALACLHSGCVPGSDAPSGKTKLERPPLHFASLSDVARLAESLDHVGPMARTVSDAAIVLQTIAGHDSNDPSSLNEPVPDMLAEIRRGGSGTRAIHRFDNVALQQALVREQRPPVE